MKTARWPAPSQSRPATTLAMSPVKPTVVLYQPTPPARSSSGARSLASALPADRKGAAVGFDPRPRLTFDPGVAHLAITPLHGGPGDPVSDLLAFGGAPTRIARPRAVERATIDFLRMERQVRPDGRRKILNGLKRHRAVVVLQTRRQALRPPRGYLNEVRASGRPWPRWRAGQPMRTWSSTTRTPGADQTARWTACCSGREWTLPSSRTLSPVTET